MPMPSVVLDLDLDELTRRDEVEVLCHGVEITAADLEGVAVEIEIEVVILVLGTDKECVSHLDGAFEPDAVAVDARVVDLYVDEAALDEVVVELGQGGAGRRQRDRGQSRNATDSHIKSPTGE